ncbi:hypothetical protein Y032_0006g3109 [Ancylostoma ceylanicum]|uniref:Peptidase A1 domain-containing protein n=1 Tax=Ancylostoma ceylanicum TaxID=53326 RepID=A0A016VQ18_9BILA|nr:hypothetical protein Y032_0006g3109 [Ancylostoma ceylanicum]
MNRQKEEEVVKSAKYMVKTAFHIPKALFQTIELPKVYDMSDFQYSQKITIGEPQQEFLVWISTGVSMFWIPHNNCTA